MTEDEMVRCHHQLNGHKVETSLGNGEGQGTGHAEVQRVANSWS